MTPLKHVLSIRGALSGCYGSVLTSLAQSSSTVDQLASDLGIPAGQVRRAIDAARRRGADIRNRAGKYRLN